MSKYKNIPNGIYKSQIERTAAALLTEAELEFEYEP